MSTWSFIQKWLFWNSVVQLVYATAGFLTNPDFSVGDDATSTTLLGVDFNGWHALAGWLLFLPGLYFARNADWARWYSWAAAASLVLTAGWTLFTEQPVWVLYFPHPNTDIIFHLVGAAILVAPLVSRRSTVVR